MGCTVGQCQRVTLTCGTDYKSADDALRQVKSDVNPNVSISFAAYLTVKFQEL